MEPLAQAIKASHWQHIEIQMIHMYGSSDMRYSVQKIHHARRFLSVLAPLRYVGGRTAIMISGLPSAQSSFLVDIMKSPKYTSFDLSDMRNCLKEYKDALTVVLQYNAYNERLKQLVERIDHVFKKCNQAKDLEDVPTFLRRRERVMFLIAKYIIAAQGAAFEDEPAGMPFFLPLVQQSNYYPHWRRFDEQENEPDSEIETNVRGFDEGDWSEETDEEDSESDD